MTALFGSLAGILFGLIIYFLNDLKKHIFAIGGQLDNLRSEFNDRFSEFNNRFSEFNNRFSETNDRFGELDKRVHENTKEIGELKGAIGELKATTSREIGELKATTSREIGELKATTFKEIGELKEAIGELKGMTSVLLSRQIGTTGEDESSGSPELGRRQEETPERQVEMSATEIGLTKQQQKKPERPPGRPDQLTENPAISGEATDRGTQARARSEAN